jgi:hypothetical protein
MGGNWLFVCLHVVVGLAASAPLNASAHSSQKPQVLTLFQNGTEEMERAFSDVYKHFEHTHA